jgi:hypothetical protein
MNNQQARIEAILFEQFYNGARSASDVDVHAQAALSLEGYDLSALDDDLYTIGFNNGY